VVYDDADQGVCAISIPRGRPQSIAIDVLKNDATVCLELMHSGLSSRSRTHKLVLMISFASKE
jgi:hypothetical protein